LDEYKYYEPLGEWAEQAACKGLTAMFFPDRHDQNAVRRARAICNQCPVKPECLEHAVRNFEPYGMRAGKGPRAISKERIKRGIADNPNKPKAHGTKRAYKNGCRCEQCADAMNNGRTNDGNN
jgi:hypothetical protein